MTENSSENGQAGAEDAPHDNREASPLALTKSKEQIDFRNTKIAFVLLFGSLFLTLIPFSVASFFSLLLSICTLSGVYSMRSLAEEDSLVENHMNFLIMTFWRVCLFVLITSIFATFFLLIFANYKQMDICVRQIDYIAIGAVRSRNASNFSLLFDYCSQLFLKNNARQITATSIIAFAPVLLYLLYRCQKGWRYIASGHFIQKN